MFIEGVRRTSRQIRKAGASFDREMADFRAKQEREHREIVAAVKTRKAILTAEVKAVLASDEAKPWIEAIDAKLKAVADG